MTWVAAAVIGGAVIGGVASNMAAEKQVGAAKDAAAASSSAARYQSDVQKQIYDQTRADQAPWRGTGESALNRLAMLMGITPARWSGAEQVGPKVYSSADLLVGSDFRPNEYLYSNDPEYRKAYDSLQKSISYVTAGGSLSDAERYQKYAGNILPALQGKIDLAALNERMKARAAKEAVAQPDVTRDPAFGELARSFGTSDFETDPGYAFRQAEGMKAIERGAAARGGLLSGAALKGIERFGQNLASDEYQNAYNRFQSNQANQFNRLASLAGVGQTANNALQQAGSQFANAMTGISQANAANQGNAMLAAGQARASGYQGIGNALSSAFQNWPQQQAQGGFGIPAGYSLGSGYAGNMAATSQGYQPLDYGTYNAMGGYYD